MMDFGASAWDVSSEADLLSQSLFGTHVQARGTKKRKSDTLHFDSSANKVDGNKRRKKRKQEKDSSSVNLTANLSQKSEDSNSNNTGAVSEKADRPTKETSISKKAKKRKKRKLDVEQKLHSKKINSNSNLPADNIEFENTSSKPSTKSLKKLKSKEKNHKSKVSAEKALQNVKNVSSYAEKDNNNKPKEHKLHEEVKEPGTSIKKGDLPIGNTDAENGHIAGERNEDHKKKKRKRKCKKNKFKDYSKEGAEDSNNTLASDHLKNSLESAELSSLDQLLPEAGPSKKVLQNQEALNMKNKSNSHSKIKQSKRNKKDLVKKKEETTNLGKKQQSNIEPVSKKKLKQQQIKQQQIKQQQTKQQQKAKGKSKLVEKEKAGNSPNVNNTTKSKSAFDPVKLGAVLSGRKPETENIVTVDSGSISQKQKLQKSDSESPKRMTLLEKSKERLKAARFRYLNEQLYTSTGSEAMAMFREDKEAFHVYHQGFQSQVEKWPANPIDLIIEFVKNRPKNQVVADFGCGDAKLAQSVSNKVHSFDLVAINKHVTVCDMTKVPLKDASVDIAVFCLSLMGTNLSSYLQEANRVLKQGGVMKIAEVTSRFRGLGSFIVKVEKMGFKVTNQDSSNKMFVLMDFKKTANVKNLSNHEIELSPCVYKKR